MKRKLAMAILMMTILVVNIFWLYIKPSTASDSIIRVPQDYGTIQEAINAANPGDTIEVAAGEYPEHVLVNKSVTLKGDNRASIIVGDGSTKIIEVNVGNVEITGFTIQDGGGWWKGIYVESWPGPLTGINITNNAIINTHEGVFLSYCIGAIISSNTIDNTYYGIRLHGSDENTIMNNKINRSRYYGINLYSGSENNEITSNEITNGKYGILHEYSDSNTLELNTIASNAEYGIRLSYSSNTLVRGNNIESNKYGVYLWDSGGNDFYYNNFIDNTYQVEHYETELTENLWDDDNVIPQARKGNYWSDYTGKDDGSGKGRSVESKLAGDKIGDTLTPHLGLDWYPLMVPWAPVPRVEPVAIFTCDPPEPIKNLIATFNASKSYDPDGDIVLYDWNFGDDTPIVSEEGPVTTHVFIEVGDYMVTLTVTDNDGLQNSTSKLITVLPYKLTIDLYTQHPDPYSGKGPNKPSDAFAPQQRVILYAEIAYNYEPVENKEVTFSVNDTSGALIIVRSESTDQDGIATTDFLLPTDPIFGTWFVLATVSVSEAEANDTLTFEVGWLIELMKIETADQYGNPENSYTRNQDMYFNIIIKNIANTTKEANLTVGISDETGTPIGVANLWIEVLPGTHEFSLIFGVGIPGWSYVGEATVYVNAFRMNGDSYCLEISTTFFILPNP